VFDSIDQDAFLSLIEALSRQ